MSEISNETNANIVVQETTQAVPSVEVITQQDVSFGKEFRGYNKKQVAEFIETLSGKCTELVQIKTQEYDEKYALLLAQYNELEGKYRDLEEKYREVSNTCMELQDSKAQVANALINAEVAGKVLISQAREIAEAEKKELEGQAEILREAIVDRHKVIRDMRIAVDNMYNDLQTKIAEAHDDILARVEKERKYFNESVHEMSQKLNQTPKEE